MPYLLGDGPVVDIAVSNSLSDPLATLQDRASRLRYLQLLRILWSDAVDPAANDDFFAAVAAFHAWLPTNIPEDYGYVLHFEPTAAQQGRLHQCLREQNAIAAVWRDGHLTLIGAIRPSLSREIVDLVAEEPNLSAEEIAPRLRYQCDEHTVRNELTRLAQQRVLARRKQMRRLPEIRLPKVRRKRNVYHYSPLWTASPSEMRQEEQTASHAVRIVTSDSLNAAPSGGSNTGI